MSMISGFDCILGIIEDHFVIVVYKKNTSITAA